MLLKRLIDLNIDMVEDVSNKRLVLFGAGLDGQIAYEYFNSKKIDIYAYCDNNKEKQNTFLNGKKIISSDELMNIENLLVVITIKTRVEEVKIQLSNMGIEHCVFGEYAMKVSLSESMDKYNYVYEEILNDDKSKEIYLSIIRSRLKGDSSEMKSLYEKDAFYCLPKFKDTINESFIDAGAYVGDTVEKFIWNCTGRFKEIYAFEPGTKQYGAMLYRTERLKKEWALSDEQIICINAGLGEKDCKMSLYEDEKNPLTNNFVCSDNGEKSNEVNVYNIDSYFKNKRVTMLKADVEGFEMEMLRGGKSLVQKQKPKMAISLYHKYEDLFEIPMYIKEIEPSYNMAIRHHSTNTTETVLYCWVD